MFLKKELFTYALLFFLVLSVVYAAGGGGGGGGGSSSGLGFSSARESIFILISQDYSRKFSLKNGTKYDFKVNVENSNVTVNFGSFSFSLELGDNYVDLNDNNLADINFNLVKVSGKRADIRIINAKDLVTITSGEPEIIIQEPEPKPEKEKQETGLRCGNLPTLQERVSCRLDLEEDEQEKELELNYLPEECGALTGSARGICIARYKSVQTCWKFPIGNERISCVKRLIKLGTLQEEKEKCDILAGQEKSTCVRELKNKVYNLIKWRFYDLEERAEDFMARGLADKVSVVDFVSKIEENKMKFNEAETKEERKNIILDVRGDWQEFINIVRGKLRG